MHKPDSPITAYSVSLSISLSDTEDIEMHVVSKGPPENPHLPPQRKSTNEAVRDCLSVFFLPPLERVAKKHRDRTPTLRHRY